MRPCFHCRRHVRLSDACCPFCGARLVEGTAPGAVSWAVGLALLGAACGPGKPQAEGSASEAGSSSGEPGTTGTTGVTSTTSTTSASETTQLPTGTTETTSGCGSAGCTDSSEAGGFIYGSPDGGTTIDCDQWIQDCPKGQKCVPASLDGDNSWEALICVPVMENPGQTGEPCAAVGSGVSGIDSCDFGNICWAVDPVTLEGICVAQCTGSPDAPQCEDPDATCLSDGDGVITLCINSCDPLIQDCSAMKVCIPDPNDPNKFECAADESGAEGQAFDPCDKPTGCDLGLTCADPKLAEECDAMATGCCLPFCDVSDPTCPGVGQQCLPWFEMGQAPPGLEDVGLCGIPQ